MKQTFTRRRLLQVTGIGALGAFCTESTAAEKPSRHNVGTDSPAAERATKQAATAIHRELTWDHGQKTISGRFPEEALDGLSRRPDVRYIESDGQYEAIAETLPWGADRIDADTVHADGETGGDNSDGEGGAHVAIIDTGIDDDHPDLQANIGTGKAFTGCSGSECNHPWSDDHDHGTHCAGIAGAIDNSKGTIGVAPGVVLHAVKVLDGNGSGYWSDVAAGIEWVADQGYDVGSISLGGTSGSSTVQDACQYAYEKGVLLVAAAGNDGECTDCVLYPARYRTVIAVSATTSDDQLASFSSTGSEIEFGAPGQSIYSTVPGGYASWSGTSMACPHVSGAGGQLMDNGYTNTDARKRLQDTAEDIGLGSNEQGYGLVDVEGSIESESSDESVAVSTGEASDVGESSATLNGTVETLGGAESVDAYFEYREVGASSWSATPAQSLTTTGSYSADVTDVTSSTEYEFRAVGEASDGDSDTGSTVSFSTQTTDTSVDVSTGSPSNVGETTATLDGSLVDMGGAESVDAAFDYRIVGVDSWNTTTGQTLSSTGSYSESVSGLTSGESYEFRASAVASDGDTDTGSTETFSTKTADTDVAVSTVGASEVGETSATLDGSLDDLGGAESVDVSFDYRATGSNSWISTAGQTLSDTGSYSSSVSELESGTEYEFRATATASDGDTDTGTIVTFSTQSSNTDTAPEIDSFTVSEAGSPNPHAEITAEWAVSDVDGDLNSVDSVVRNDSGVVATDSTSVSGSSASGTDKFKIKHGGGTTYDVTLTVVDGKGNATSRTEQVNASGGKQGK